MRNGIKNLLMAGVIFALGIFYATPVQAADVKCTGGISGDCNPICSSSADETQKAAAGCNTASNDYVGKHIENIINAAISVIGIIGVLVIVIAGQRFMTANGDPGKIKQAKDMILWAIVGIIIAVLAWAIVTFILNAFNTGP